VVQLDDWEQAHFNEEEVRNNAKKAKKDYEDTIRQSLLGQAQLRVCDDWQVGVGVLPDSENILVRNDEMLVLHLRLFLSDGLSPSRY
jgi:hypothetical protein